MSGAKCTTQEVQGTAIKVQNFTPTRNPTSSGCRQNLCCALFPFFIVCLPASAPSAELSDNSAFVVRLASLASKCDELGLKEQAEITRRWSIQQHDGRRYLFLPSDSDPTAPRANAADMIEGWHRKFNELRRERADELFTAAKSASQADKAYRLVFETLRENPDHAEARRVLGFTRIGNDWKLPGAEKATPRQPAFDHPKTGWRARGWWSLETPHFQIASNDQRELKEAAQQLENLDSLWRQIFFSYWSTPKALRVRFATGNEPLAPERPKMQVVLFKTRQEYAKYVASSHPKAASTLGIYDDKQRVSYFFAGDKSVYPTWYHEATHQLFREAIANTRDDSGNDRDFWALEGVALYMESLAEHNGYWTVGGWEADRLQFARYRVRSGDLKLPLAQIGTLSREQIQKSEDIGRIYTQAAGLAHFLIDAEGGKYRQALIDLVTAVYRGDNTSNLLATATGQPLEKLDEQYREFLNVTDTDVAAIPDPARLKSLSLCRTNVSDEGLALLGGCKILAWLDLSFTTAGDEGLNVFAKNSGLKQLFLEGTKITRASLPVIAGFKQLEELDLSQLPVHDDDLAPLAALRLLKTMYLTGCPVTDEGLAHLRGLKQLERLDTSGTKITEEGLRKLKTAIPKLK